MKIGILGTGVVGTTLGTRLVALGHDVKLGARDPANEKAAAWAARTGTRASHGTFADAAAHGELLINCTLGAGSLPALQAAGAERLRNKILVDIANPLDFSRGMPPSLFVSNTDSLGEQIQRAFPELRVVKALNTINCEVMVDPARLGGDSATFVSGNDVEAKRRVVELLREGFGWRSVIDLGDITTARGTEAYLLLWIRLWGALGTGDFNVQNHPQVTKEGVMEAMQLGKSGLQVPRLGVGAMTWGNPAAISRFNPARLAYGLADGRDEEQRAIDVSVAAGVNLVDTAAMYGKGASERRVGELAHGRDLVIATKFPLSMLAGAGRLPSDLAASLSRLERGAIDLYQVHFPVFWRSIPRLMNLMADAVEAGKIRAVGVSNFSAPQMRLAHQVLARRGVPLASNQVQYSLLHRKPEIDGTLDACRELGVTLIAYMPLASGALTGKYSPTARPTGLRRRMAFFKPKNHDAVARVVDELRAIGERQGKSIGQVALRWLIERGALPIPGAKNGEQAAHNAGALTFSLTAAEVASLDRVSEVWRR